MECPDPDTLNAFAAQTLSSQQRALIADHAGSCDDCRALVGALVGVEADPDRTERIGRYEIERVIGAGGMGVVYAARDPELARPVAIKVLRGGGSDARLRQEAQALAKLDHPNVVAVYDVGVHRGEAYVVMALVDGENLRSWLAREHTTPEILRAIRDAGRGLAAAHAAGLVHRDVKPDNIFVARDGRVLVGDFGLARVADARAEAAVAGTPAYMAPEQARGDATAASDQFSLCVTAKEALRDRKVPARVQAALERGLSPDPSKRFRSVDALAAAIAPRGGLAPWLALGGVALAATGVALFFALRTPADRCAETAHELDAIQLPASPVLEAYARDWLAVRKDACLAGCEADDPRTQCLDRARDALRSLAAAPGSDVDALHDAALALPRVAECRTALAGDLVPAGEALVARVGDASVRASLSHGPQELAVLRALLAEAKAMPYERAIVGAARELGSDLARAGQVEEGAAMLRDALAVAEAAHDDAAVARLAAALVPISLDLHRLDEARTLVELGAAAFARAGTADSETELDLASARVRVASEAGDHDRAIEMARALIAPMSARRGADSLEVTELYVLLARACVAAGRMAEASEALAHARVNEVARAKLHGAGDLVTLAAQAESALVAGEIPRAIELSRELVALADDLKISAGQIEARSTLATCYTFAFDGPRMVETYQAMLDLLAAESGGGAQDQRGEANLGIGTGWLEQHQPDKAIAPLRAAVAAYGEHGANRVLAVTRLGEALVEAGYPRDARAVLEPLERSLADAPDATAARRAGAEYHLARALWDDGDAHDRARALALAEQAGRDYQAALDSFAGQPAVFGAGMRRRIPEVAAWLARRRN